MFGFSIAQYEHQMVYIRLNKNSNESLGRLIWCLEGGKKWGERISGGYIDVECKVEMEDQTTESNKSDTVKMLKGEEIICWIVNFLGSVDWGWNEVKEQDEIKMRAEI